MSYKWRPLLRSSVIFMSINSDTYMFLFGISNLRLGFGYGCGIKTKWLYEGAGPNGGVFSLGSFLGIPARI